MTFRRQRGSTFQFRERDQRERKNEKKEEREVRESEKMVRKKECRRRRHETVLNGFSFMLGRNTMNNLKNKGTE